MSKLHRAGLLAGIILASVASPSRAVDPKDIEKAIETGVHALRRLQNEDGTWPPYREMGGVTSIGATALAGLALLECGAKPEDKDVQRAAEALRQESLKLTHNYSISLTVLFFDRLGDPRDIPLIESLTVRLLAGQSQSGGWSYYSPPISDSEVRRLQGKLGMRKELVGHVEMPRPGGVKRTEKDLAPEIHQQLGLLKRFGGGSFEVGSDNSNTQFATLALWVARRYGLPVDSALKRVETRFRNTQHSDGGWGYFDPSSRMSGGPMGRSTASMTCAGLLGLAVGDGTVTERARERHPRAKPPRDINKDPAVRRGLFALSRSIGKPVENKDGKHGRQTVAIPQIGGRSYYFLWSLERVAVALDLKTIGKKDWYGWGAEILLANQQADGSWQGNYGSCGADTCFALLFLRRANLVPDLTMQLTGRIQDPGDRVLKVGELREGMVQEPGGDLKSGVEGKDAKPTIDGKYPEEAAKVPTPQAAAKTHESRPIIQRLDPPPLAKRETSVPHPGKTQANKTHSEEAEPSFTASMAADLAKSSGTRFSQLLHNYRIGKGGEFTEALALAIPQMKGDSQRKVREALTDRLTRMKESTLKEYLSDEILEIRIAAAHACAIKGFKSLVPNLIPLLRDDRGGITEAAHQALKQLTGQDFGPKANANREERVRASRHWAEWWNKQEGK